MESSKADARPQSPCVSSGTVSSLLEIGELPVGCKIGRVDCHQTFSASNPDLVLKLSRTRNDGSEAPAVSAARKLMNP